jgi:hypothetical protein
MLKAAFILFEKKIVTLSALVHIKLTHMSVARTSGEMVAESYKGYDLY